MVTTKMVLNINTTEIQSQISDLCNALSSAYGSLEAVPDEVISRILDGFHLAGNDIICRHGVATTGADGSLVIPSVPRFGIDFERLISAVRAGEFNADINVH